MIFALYASLLLATAAQDPNATPDPAAPQDTYGQNGDVYTEQPADTQDANGQQDTYTPVATPEQPVEPAVPAATQVEEEEEPEEPMVCRRQMTFDAFNRQRSRKVCRPRDEW